MSSDDLLKPDVLSEVILLCAEGSLRDPHSDPRCSSDSNLCTGLITKPLHDSGWRLAGIKTIALKPCRQCLLTKVLTNDCF